MSLRNTFRTVFRQARRGSALIITLGILSLLLIVCMVFAFDARSQRKAAFNHAAAVRARLINESGFKRATAILDDLLGNITTNNVFMNPGSRFFPDPGSGTWSGTRYLPNLGSGAAFTDGIDSAYATNFSTGSSSVDYTSDSDLFTADVTDSATWTNISVDSIIGSYTYLIIDKTGQLPPEYIGTSNPAAYGDLTGTLTDLDLSDAGITASDYVADTETCFGIADYFRNAPSPATSVTLGLICPGTYPEKEQFWNVNYVNDGGSKACFDTEIFDRMDVTRIGNGITVDSVYNFLLTGDSTVDGNTITDSAQSLWLQGLDEYVTKPATNPVTKATSINVSEAKKLAAQMALNMVDAADADSTGTVAAVDGAGNVTFTELSTFDPSAGKAGTTALLYGVEKAILENVSIFVDFTSWNNVANTCTGEITIDLSVYSPMKEVLTAPAVRLELYYNIGGQTGTVTPTMLSTSVSGWHYTFTNDPATPINFAGATTTAAAACTAASIEIRALQIIENGNICRRYPMFARGASDSYATFMTISGLCNDVQVEDLQYMVQNESTTDPFFFERDIMSPKPASPFDALWTQQEDGGGDYLMKSTNAGKVAMVAPVFYYDAQDYSDVQCDNAGYIRIGELGRLHSPHHDKKSVRFWVEDNTDTDGDWHDAYLLDMFKSGTQLEARKININTPSPAVLDTLITLAQLSNATEKLDAVGGQDDDLRDNMLAISGSAPFLHRGDIFNAFDEKHVSAVGGVEGDITKDAKIEGAIATFIELLGTRHNYYHVITASRSIKDLGPIPAVVAEARGAVQITATNYGEVEGQYKTLTEVYRDAWKRESKVLRINVLEE